MYIIVSKGAGAVDTAAGVPSADQIANAPDNNPAHADCATPDEYTGVASSGDGLTLTVGGGGWATVEANDYLVFDTASAKTLCQVQSVDGTSCVLKQAVAFSETNKTVHVGGHLATIQAAANRIARMQVLRPSESHTIYIESGTYAEEVTIPTAGTATYPVHFVGFTTTVTDGGPTRPVITGSNTRANGFKTSVAGTGGYWMFENLDVTACTGNGFSAAKLHSTFRNCRAYSNGAHGFLTADYTHLYNCEGYSNTSGYGIYAGGYNVVYGCKAYSNGTTYQIRPTYWSTVENCQVWGLPTNGIGIGALTGYPLWVRNCTVDGGSVSGTVGIAQGTAAGTLHAIGNIVLNCATGISLHASGSAAYISANNCLYNCTNNYSNYSTQSGEVTTNPLFVNAGTRDYRLQASSPCKGTGFPVSLDIGALNRIEPTVPPLATILDSQTAIGELGAQAGTYHAPEASEVWHTAVFGPGSATSGTKTASSITNCTAENIREDTVIDDVTGDLELPAAADVKKLVGYGSGGTEYTGTYILAATLPSNTPTHLLHDICTIQKPTPTKDTGGSPVMSYSNQLVNIRCLVQPAAPGSDNLEQGKHTGKTWYVIFIEPGQGVKPSWRVLWNSKTLNVISASEPDNKKRFMRIDAYSTE